MKTSFMKKYIQQELRDPRVVQIINSVKTLRRNDEFQDHYEFEDDGLQTGCDWDLDGFTNIDNMSDNVQKACVGEEGFSEVNDEKARVFNVKGKRNLIQVLRKRVQEIIELERQKKRQAAKKEGGHDDSEDMEKKSIGVTNNKAEEEKVEEKVDEGSGTAKRHDDDDLSFISNPAFKVSVGLSQTPSLVSKASGSVQSTKEPPSKYFLDEDVHCAPITNNSITDSLNSSDVNASASLDDNYSTTLKSAVYDMLDKAVLETNDIAIEKADDTRQDSVDSNTEVRASSSSKKTLQVRTASFTSDDGLSLLAPPSPTQPNPHVALKGRYGRSVVTLGAPEEQKFKLEQKEDYGSITTVTHVPVVSGTLPQILEVEPPSNKTPSFPYQPPSALKHSSNFTSPRLKNTKVTSSQERKKVLFTKDLINKT